MRFEPYPRPRLKPPPLSKMAEPEPTLPLTSKVRGVPPILKSSLPRPTPPPARPKLPRPQHHTVMSPSTPPGPPPRQHHTVVAPATPPGPPPRQHHTVAAPSTPLELPTKRKPRHMSEPRPPSVPPPGHGKCLVMIPPLSARLHGALPQILHHPPRLVRTPVAEKFE